MNKKREFSVSPNNIDLEPAWLNPCNDRKSPYTDTELDRFVEDFIATMHDVPAVNALIESNGIRQVKAFLKEIFLRRDKNNLVNMNLKDPRH